MKPFSSSLVALAVFGLGAMFTGCSGTSGVPATSEKPESAAQIPAKRTSDPRAMPTTVRLWLT